MVVTNELIDELSALAKLSFSADEKQAIQADLSKMIGFIDQLQSLDIPLPEPLLHMGDARNALRADEVSDGLPRDAALQNAPATHDVFFTVPKVIAR